MDLVLLKVKEFLKEHYQEGSPLLLGFSGGPDSLALLHLLLECRRFYSGIELHLAHVDHNWRPESSEEAAKLSDFAESLGLPFHLRVLEKEKEFTSNIEEKGRDARLQFFRELHSQLNCQAVILAHQKDDQAETVLKRIFEGASLFSLGGMQPVSDFSGVRLWRPLLKLSKREILDWLEKRELKPLDDPTNRDPKFLRSRMRTHIFPQIADQFGKEISDNLCHLAENARDVKEYFHRKNELFFSQIVIGVDESTLDFNPFFPLEKVELRAFFKQFAFSAVS